MRHSLTTQFFQNKKTSTWLPACLNFLKALGLSLFTLCAPNLLSACDTSGFFIDNITENPDGTFTVTLTIEVAGSGSTYLGPTWGFFFNANNPILSVTPPTLTSFNGTTINSVITGNTVTWGDPTSTTGTPFVHHNNDPTQSFTVTLILGSIDGNWNGGGQETNNCPGGAGTTPSEYMGPWPCPLPAPPQVIAPPLACPNELFTLTAILANPTYTVTWTPPGMTGNPIMMSVPETTTVTVQVQNACGAVTSIPVLIEVTPLPTISAVTPTQEICEGGAAIIEVIPMNETSVVWDPPGAGNFQVVQPTMSPMTYTATAINACGEASTEMTVTTVPIPTLELLNDDESICVGESVTLEAISNVNITWNPGGIIGESIEVDPTESTIYTATVSNICGTLADGLVVNVFQDVEEMITLEACTGTTVNYEGEALEPGSFTQFVFTSFNGCDSTVSVTVIELPTYSSDLELEACEGNSITYNGQELEAGAVEEVIFMAFNGCDSVVTVTVLELETYETNLTLEACTNTTVSYNNEDLEPGDSESYLFIAENGCDSTVNVFVAELETFSSDLQLEACTGTTISYNNLQLQPGTISTFTFEAQNTCDSIVTVTVTELEVIEETLNLTACESEMATYNGQNLAPGSVTDFPFITAGGCDSIVTVIVQTLTEFDESLELEACNGTTVSYNSEDLTPGSVTNFTFAATNGCDSLVTVTVIELPTYDEPLELGTCTGTTVPYNGENLTPNTVTSFTFIAQNGCDSIVTVTVNELQILTSELDLETCPNTTIEYEGQDLAVGSVTEVFFTASNGCDSSVTVTVMPLPEFDQPLQLETCTGTTINYNGQDLAPGTMTEFIFPAQNGCDSTVTVTVEELQILTSELDLQACTNEIATYEGQDLAPGTVMDFMFTSQGGCDSVVTVTVEELQTFAEPVELEACTGTMTTYEGQDLAPGTVMDFTFNALNGCDSIVTVTVIELQTFTATENLQACEGSTVMYNGQELQPNTTTDILFIADNGCDSMVTVMVEEVTDFTSAEALEACPNSTANYNGQELPPGTMTQFLFTAQNGCDSIVTVTVEESAAFFTTLDLEACPGASVLYDGQNLATGSVTEVMFIASTGCDSIVTVTVNELPTFTSPLQLEACPGESISYNGQNLLAGTTTDITLTAQNGCDSTVTVMVMESPTFASPLDLAACPGASVIYNGQNLLAGTVTDITLTAQNGCDSVVTVTVDELSTFVSLLQLEACPGESVLYNGQNLLAGSITDVTLTAQNGCDSVVTVNVAALQTSSSVVNLQDCDGVPVFYQGVEIPIGTSQDFTFAAANGCDSVVTVSALTPFPTSATFETASICPGSSIIIFGEEVTDAGNYSEVFTNAFGCDSTHTITLSVGSDITLSTNSSSSCLSANTGSADVSVSGGVVPYNFNWDVTTENSATIEELAPGTYFVTVTDALGCTATTEVNIGNFELEFDVFGDLNCFGDTDGTLSVDAPGSGLTYSLDGTNFTNTPDFANLSADTYEVFVIDANGCLYSQPFTLSNPPQVTVAFAAEIQTIDLGETVFLNPQTNVLSPTFTWAASETLSCLDCRNPIANPVETTNYQVLVTDANGCTAIANVTVVVESTRKVYIPNVFSPNGDGFNDYFTIFGNPKSIANIVHFQVFSRWGESVFLAPLDFQPNNISIGWDGTYRDEKMNPGVFAYFAIVEFVDGSIEFFKGDVSLAK